MKQIGKACQAERSLTGVEIHDYKGRLYRVSKLQRRSRGADARLFVQQLGGATTPSGCTRSTATKPHGGYTTLLATPLPRCAGPAHTTLLPVLWLSCQRRSAWALDPMRRGPRPVAAPPGIALLLGPWYLCQGSPACALKPMRRGSTAVGAPPEVASGGCGLGLLPRPHSYESCGCRSRDRCC